MCLKSNYGESHEHNIDRENAADDLIAAEAVVHGTLVEIVSMRLHDRLAVSEAAKQRDGRICQILEQQ
jgi:hypothetical protein